MFNPLLKLHYMKNNHRIPHNPRPFTKLDELRKMQTLYQIMLDKHKCPVIKYFKTRLDIKIISEFYETEYR